MSDTEYDFVSIGGGSAGYAAASTAAGLGLKTAVIEGAEEVGGLCILRGCMPSKTLLESGHRAEAIRNAAVFGLRAEYRGADAVAIRDRKRRLVREFANHRAQQLEDGRFDFIRGRATFSDPHEIEVSLLGGGSRRIRAQAFLISTGSSIHTPQIPGLAETGCLTSDDALDADHIPESIVILGGGAIALEFASYYSGIGSQVTVIQRSSQVLKEMDQDVADALTAAMEKRGIVVFRDTTVRNVGRAGSKKRVEFSHAGVERSVEADEVLCALGRQPNVHELGLARAGVPIAKTGLQANARQQTQQPHIFAAGDVCGPHEVVHIAIQQGELAARNAARLLHRLQGDLESVDFGLKLFAVFTHPEVASLGLTEHEAALLRYDVVVAKYCFADLGKAEVRGVTDGFVKLLAEKRTRRILGAACVGDQASELIHEIAVAMYFGATAGDLARVPHYHPTLSEIWTYPAEELILP
jgi:pyruvate/2-oxoglutarate dehydrogenase complex dihydrolipoamide dehydrogenase (E3) component